MKRTLSISVLLLVLGGCATILDGMFNYDQRFYELNGSTLSSVIAKMGLPDNQYELGDSKVYIWTNRLNQPDPLYGGSTVATCEVKMVARTNYGEKTYIVRRVEVNGSGQAPCTPSKWERVGKPTIKSTRQCDFICPNGNVYRSSCSNSAISVNNKQCNRG